MSVHTKKHLISVTIDGEKYRVSRSEKKAILTLIEGLQSKEAKRASNLEAEDVLGPYRKGRPRGAVYLRGLRERDNISQKELSGKTSISVPNISAYENGARKITENVAKKLGKAFGVKDFKKFMAV